MNDPKAGFIGKAVERKEDYGFLTGAGQYTDDVTPAAVMNAVTDALWSMGIRDVSMPASQYTAWKTIQAARH